MAVATVSKAVINAGVLKRRALIRAGKFRVKLPAPPNPFRLLHRKGVQESGFYQYLKSFEGRGKGTGLLSKNSN